MNRNSASLSYTILSLLLAGVLATVFKAVFNFEIEQAWDKAVGPYVKSYGSAHLDAFAGALTGFWGGAAMAVTLFFVFDVSVRVKALRSAPPATPRQPEQTREQERTGWPFDKEIADAVASKAKVARIEHEQTIVDGVVFLPDALGYPSVRKATFVRCLFIGPAILSVAGCEFKRCKIRPDDGQDVFYEIVDKNDNVFVRSGELRFTDCIFLDCEFYNIGFTGYSLFLYEVRKGLVRQEIASLNS